MFWVQISVKICVYMADVVFETIVAHDDVTFFGYLYGWRHTCCHICHKGM